MKGVNPHLLMPYYVPYYKSPFRLLYVCQLIFKKFILFLKVYF